MTYLAQETSVEDGQPIELYRFTNLEQGFFYTNGPDEVVYLANTYLPRPISRGKPELQQVQSDRTLTITLTASDPFVQRYIATVPASTDLLEIVRFHSTDGGSPEVTQFFDGHVTGCKLKGNNAEITVRNTGSIMERLIPQQTTRNSCNHILYDLKCAVIENNFSMFTTVTAISADGFDVTVDGGSNTIPNTGLQLSAQVSADSTYFITGILSRQTQLESRMVLLTVDQTGDIVKCTLQFPFQILSVGTELRLSAGCEHIWTVCKAKFSNGIRYGGFPHIPDKNPFTAGVKE